MIKLCIFYTLTRLFKILDPDMIHSSYKFDMLSLNLSQHNEIHSFQHLLAHIFRKTIGGTIVIKLVQDFYFPHNPTFHKDHQYRTYIFIHLKVLKVIWDELENCGLYCAHKNLQMD